MTMNEFLLGIEYLARIGAAHRRAEVLMGPIYKKKAFAVLDAEFKTTMTAIQAGLNEGITK